MGRLFIAEKPSLANAIADGLGDPKNHNGYIQCGADKVTWCFGHILETFDPEDYNSDFKKWKLTDLPLKTVNPPKLKPSKIKQLNIILNLIKEAKTIVNAGDVDSEGQLLIDEVIEYSGTNKEVSRVLVSDLNLAPVKKALANLEPNANYKNLYNVALARSLADKSYGYNFTRLCTLIAQNMGNQGVLSVGRVQTQVLGLVNSRSLANSNHQSSFYYDVTATLQKGEQTIKAKYITKETDQVDEKGRLISEANANFIVDNVKEKTATVALAVSKINEKSAPLPLNLTALQKICAKKLSYTASETLEVMQSLYEDLKVITYPRTDSRYLTDEIYFQSKDILKQAFKNIAGQIDNLNGCSELDANFNLKHAAFNDAKVDAHHAIVPTLIEFDINKLNEKQKNIYGIICTYYAALFFEDSKREQTKVNFYIDGDQFTANQSVLLKRGWEALFSSDDNENDDDVIDSINDLKNLVFNDQLETIDQSVTAKKTKPPRLFAESSLLTAMEKASLGTEATRASILDKIKNSDLISVESVKGYKEKCWVTTKKGQEFCDTLPDVFTSSFISEEWGEAFKQIGKGELSVNDFIKSVDQFIDDKVSEIKESGLNLSVESFKCPECGKALFLNTKGKFGAFFGCTGYAEGCKTTLAVGKDGKPVPKAKVEKSEHKCECGEALIKRESKAKKSKFKTKKSKSSNFWFGCSSFPKCKNTYKEENGKLVPFSFGKNAN